MKRSRVRIIGFTIFESFISFVLAASIGFGLSVLAYKLGAGSGIQVVVAAFFSCVIGVAAGSVVCERFIRRSW